MTRYSDTVRDQNGNTLPGVAVTVVSDVDGSLAALTDDGGNALPNPFTTDQYGNYYFNVAPGYYDLLFYYGGRQVFKNSNVNIGAISQLPAGTVVKIGRAHV